MIRVFEENMNRLFKEMCCLIKTKKVKSICYGQGVGLCKSVCSTTHLGVRTQELPILGIKVVMDNLGSVRLG